MPGAAMQGEPGLDQRSGDVAGQRRQRIVSRQRAAVTVSQPGHRVRQFRTLGESTHRAKIRRLVAKVRVSCVVGSERVQRVVGHTAPP